MRIITMNSKLFVFLIIFFILFLSGCINENEDNVNEKFESMRSMLVELEMFTVNYDSEAWKEFGKELTLLANRLADIDLPW